MNFFKESHKLKHLIKKIISLKLVRLIFLILVVITLFPFILFWILKPKIPLKIYYGTTFSNKYASALGLNWQDAYLKVLDELGAKNIRVIAYWDEIEKTKNQYDFSNIKWQLNETDKRNVNIILTMGRKVPRYPECFVPNWWNDLSENEQTERLYKYINETVTQLKGYKSIKIWQVENEPFFKFGGCEKMKREIVESEIKIVRNLDNRDILTQDSGEGGFWYPSYVLGDFVGISMYRRIWFDFWGLFLGKFIYFQYPLANWTYKIKADLLQIPTNKIIVTELQAEPWGPKINSQLDNREKDKTMSKENFLETITYAQRTGFDKIYFWGSEWWLWEKEMNNNPFFWDTAKALFSSR